MEAGWVEDTMLPWCQRIAVPFWRSACQPAPVAGRLAVIVLKDAVALSGTMEPPGATT